MRRKREKGFTLILSLVLLLVMSLMGGSLIVVTSSDHSANNTSDQYQQAFYVAETALLEAEKDIINSFIGKWTTTCGDDGCTTSRDPATKGLPPDNDQKIEKSARSACYNSFKNITFHRDDYFNRLKTPKLNGTNIDESIDEKTVILVDDVLYTGRTIRAAINSLLSFGRPKSIQLAVLVDRGHRELPIRADYVGKNIPTHEGEHVEVLFKEIDNQDSIRLIRNEIEK